MASEQQMDRARPAALKVMILTYKYRLKGKRVGRFLRHHAWAVNQVWNYCVEIQRVTHRRFQQGANAGWPSQYELQALTRGTSKEFGIHAQSVQSACEIFTKSRNRSKKCPRFRKSSGTKRSLGWIPFQRQSRQVEANSVFYLGKKFRFFGQKRRSLPEIVKGGCFAEDALGRWWVCFDVEIATDRTVGSGQVGIDLGLKHLATLSTGEKVENIRSYQQLQDSLAKAQRAGNKRRVKVIHNRIRNVRNDHNHKATTEIVRANKFIVIGNVSPSKLSKTKMAKSVLDAGWSTFRNQLEYKASRHQAVFLEVDEAFSTQRCSSCGVIPLSSPKGMGALGIREWDCSNCGAHHDRDVNAAKNILAIGLSAQPRVDESQVDLVG